MRAVVLTAFGGPLTVEEISRPEPRPGEALIRVAACGVDHLDVAIRAGARQQARLPVILGHEVSGTIEAVGTDADRARVGEVVAATLYVTCGVCRECRSGRETICRNFQGYIGAGEHQGGYAEYLCLPIANLVALPEGVDVRHAAVLANTLGTAFHALVTRMQIRPGERLLITGAGGGVGLHAVQLARAVGARVAAMDLSEPKLAAAAHVGAELTVNASAETAPARVLADWSHGAGVDAVLELVGAATLPMSTAVLRRGGRVVVVGSDSGPAWTVDPRAMVRDEWSIKGSRNCSKNELSDVVQLVAAGTVHPLIDTLYRLEDVEQAHERQRAGDVIGRNLLVPDLCMHGDD